MKLLDFIKSLPYYIIDVFRQPTMWQLYITFNDLPTRISDEHIVGIHGMLVYKDKDHVRRITGDPPIKEDGDVNFREYFIDDLYERSVREGFDHKQILVYDEDKNRLLKITDVLIYGTHLVFETKEGL